MTLYISSTIINFFFENEQPVHHVQSSKCFTFTGSVCPASLLVVSGQECMALFFLTVAPFILREAMSSRLETTNRLAGNAFPVKVKHFGC